MELIHHFLGMRIVCFIELGGIPTVLSPVLPVLNKGIDRNLALTEFRANIENFFFRCDSVRGIAGSRRPTSGTVGPRR